jgi:hypothetical protein
LITGGERPRVGPVGHGQEPQRGQVELAVIFRGQKAPVEVSAFADGDGGSVLRHHLHPRRWIHLLIPFKLVKPLRNDDTEAQLKLSGRFELTLPSMFSLMGPVS